MYELYFGFYWEVIGPAADRCHTDDVPIQRIWWRLFRRVPMKEGASSERKPVHRPEEGYPRRDDGA